MIPIHKPAKACPLPSRLGSFFILFRAIAPKIIANIRQGLMIMPISPRINEAVAYPLFRFVTWTVSFVCSEVTGVFG